MRTQRIASNRFAPMVVLMAGTFMVVLDFFIVNVALPSISAELHGGSGATEWIVAGYGLSLAALLISAGRLGDAFGRRRVLVWGLALFSLASGACGAAPTADVLVAARIVQGVGAALIGPSVLSIIGVVYEGEDRNRALGVYGLVLGLAAAGGQLIGGVLIHLDLFGLGWRNCFLINLPVGAAAIALAPRLVPESRAPVEGARGSSLDPMGTALLTAGLLALILPLVEGRQHGWPLWSWCSLALAPAMLAALVGQQRARRRAGRPVMIEPEVLAERAFTGGLGLQILFWAGQASFFLILALYLQDGRGLGALAAGGIFTITAAAYVLASLAAPALAERHGRRVVLAGAVLLAGGHAALLAAVADVGTGGSVWVLAPGLALAGTGMGLCITPLTAISLSRVPPQSAGAASGALSTVQQVGNALGVAVTGALFFGALRGGYGHAFEAGAAELAALLAAVAALTRVLPPAPRRASLATGTVTADA